MHEETIVPARRAARRDPSETVVAFAETLARVAAGGGGTQALAAQLAGVLDAAVLVEDGDWRHLALAGTGERSVPPSVRDLLPKDAGDGTEGIPLSAPADGRAFAIRAGDARVGWLSVFPARGAADDRRALIRLAAASIAVEVSRESAGGKGRRRSFWDRLLARAYDDPIEAREDAAARGITLAPAYVAVAIEAEGLDESSAAAKNAEIRRVCLDALGKRSGDVVVIERGGGFLFLMPAAHEVDAQNARTGATLLPRALARAGIDVRVVGGVGRRCELLHAAASVDEAREATTIARRMFGGGKVMPHDDLGVYPLLFRGGGSREEWKVFAQRVLEPLRAYDDKHQTELVRTLRLFFDVGQNIKVAAASLNVHRHTVFYRLRQIAEIGGLDLDSPHDQLTLRAAIAIDALGG
ncbi:MAG: PucR family transcriptional regulator [Candidatus Velthaea sp.]